MKKMNRRTFMQESGGTLAAGLSLASPAILKAQSPGERINIGVIGTGSQGCHLIRRISPDDILRHDIRSRGLESRE